MDNVRVLISLRFKQLEDSSGFLPGLNGWKIPAH